MGHRSRTWDCVLEWFRKWEFTNLCELECSGEPNNAPNAIDGDEDYAHIADPAVALPFGSWNDLPNPGGSGLYSSQKAMSLNLEVCQVIPLWILLER